MVKNERARAILLVAVVFVLGGAAGGAITAGVLHRRHAEILGEGGPGFAHRRLRVMSRKLNLDDSQRAKFAEILVRAEEDHRKLGRETMDRCGQPLREHRAKVEAEMKSVLRPDQVERFEKFRSGPPFGGPGPMGEPPDR